MADDKNRLSFWARISEFVKDHWGEIYTFLHIANGALQGRVSDKAPDTAKDILAAVLHQYGGKGDPKDEVNFKHLIRRLSKSERYWLYLWLGHDFPVEHENGWVRNRAIEALEEFRVIVCAMGTPPVMGERTNTTTGKDADGNTKKTEEKETYEIKPGDDTLAYEYLLDIANTTQSLYETAVQTAGKKITDLSPEERHDFERMACAIMSKQMRLEGSPRSPGEDEKSFAAQVRTLLSKAGPAGYAASESLLRGIWHIAQISWGKSKTTAPKVWLWIEEQDRKVMQYATNLRAAEHSRLTWWGAYKQHRATGADAKTSIRTAGKTARDSRQGAWKRLSYRIANMLNPFS